MLKLVDDIARDVARFSVGLDTFFTDLYGETTKEAQNYPPFNVIKNDNKYTIEIALAGYNEKDIDIQLVNLTNSSHKKIVITGKVERKEGSSFLHQGIANRTFCRTFIIANTVSVVNAEFRNGLLQIHLEDVVPVPPKSRKILINQTSPIESKQQLLNENPI